MRPNSPHRFMLVTELRKIASGFTGLLCIDITSLPNWEKFTSLVESGQDSQIIIEGLVRGQRFSFEWETEKNILTVRRLNEANKLADLNPNSIHDPTILSGINWNDDGACFDLSIQVEEREKVLEILG